MAVASVGVGRRSRKIAPSSSPSLDAGQRRLGRRPAASRPGLDEHLIAGLRRFHANEATGGVDVAMPALDSRIAAFVAAERPWSGPKGGLKGEKRLALCAWRKFIGYGIAFFADEIFTENLSGSGRPFSPIKFGGRLRARRRGAHLILRCSSVECDTARS